MWRDLIARINSGFGHEQKAELQPGDLAIFCPACPQPGINLPDKWNQDPKRYITFTSANNSVLTVLGGCIPGVWSLMGIFLQNI